MSDAELIVKTLTQRGGTVATAESLTGGLVAAALTDVPGASVVFRGGVVAYATAVKHDVLGISGTLMDEQGVVSEQCVVEMAFGVRRVCDADWGVATSGVAGPDPAEGHPPGTVWVAVVGPSMGPNPAPVFTRLLQLDGDRAAVRAGTVEAALGMLVDILSPVR